MNIIINNNSQFYWLFSYINFRKGDRMNEINKEKILSFAQNCIEEGKDKYIVLTYKGDTIAKEFNKLSKHDTIFAKIVLMYKDGLLNYKILEFDNPYKIYKRIKFKDLEGKNQKYLILFLPEIKKYTIQTPQNPILFDDSKEAEKLIYKFEELNKCDREWCYGITKRR